MLLDTLRVNINPLSQVRLEQDFRAAEALLAKDNLSAIWKYICFLASLGLRSFLKCLFIVLNDVGHRLLHDLNLDDFVWRRESFLSAGSL